MEAAVSDRMRLVSACLLGVDCAWHGGNHANARALSLLGKGGLVPVCPEQLGGLPTPRTPQEIVGGTGEDVLDGRCRVLNRNGEDVTDQFLRGADETLRIARLVGATVFIAKSRSPSCGSGLVHDGSFTGTLVPGDGVTASLLRRHGIDVVPEEDL
jgi:uncharacterized protein YbbK (DUF523 family)